MKKQLAAGLTAVTIILFLLLFAACGIIAYLILSQPSEGGGAQNVSQGGAAQNGSGTNGTTQANGTLPSNVSQEDLSLWNDITNENVESACLARAKEEAGSSASMVYGCACEESKSDGRKTYACDISTADPFTQYFANIDCFLEARACTVETNYGTATATFGQIREWSGR